jgi:hypothetical protein
MRNRYLFGLAVIFLSVICIDFYIKITCSNNSTSGKNYMDLYESQNLYRLKNIYLVILVNIVLGSASVFLLLKSRNLEMPKLIVYTLVSIASLLTALNLFSML